MIALLVDWWNANAVAFLVGATVLMVTGALSLAVSRAPIHRRRLAESVVAVFWIWLLLAIVPSPSLRRTVVAGPSPVLLDVAPELTAVDAPVVLVVANPTSTVDALAIVGAGLVAGAALMLLRLVFALVGLRRLLRRSAPAPANITALAHALPLASCRLRVLVSREVARPFCCGVLRPCVVLPASLLQARAGDGSVRDLRPVLLHELAHLAQGDLLGHLLFALAAPLLFWNPLFWWIRREAGLAAELVADDLAARHLDKGVYVRELIDLAEGLPAASLPRGAALAVLGRPTEFFRRMNMLLQRRDRLATRCSNLHAFVRRSSALLVAITGSLGWASPALIAQDTPAKASTAPTPAPAAETKRTVTVTFAVTGDAKPLFDALTSLMSPSIAIVRAEFLRGDGNATPSATAKVVAADKETATNVGRDAVQEAAPPTSLTATQATTLALPAATTPATPAAEARTPEPRVFFNFEDADVTRVIASISMVSEKTILVPSTLTGKVTVLLRNVPCKEALLRTVEQVGCTVTEDAKGTLVVSKKDAAAK